MYRTIGCIDGRTGEKGCFGFKTKVKTIYGDRFYSCTPVFDDIVGFYNYVDNHNIKYDPSPVMFEDVPYRNNGN